MKVTPTCIAIRAHIQSNQDTVKLCDTRVTCRIKSEKSKLVGKLFHAYALNASKTRMHANKHKDVVHILTSDNDAIPNSSCNLEHNLCEKVTLL